jgi:hypothetical protein
MSDKFRCVYSNYHFDRIINLLSKQFLIPQRTQQKMFKPNIRGSEGAKHCCFKDKLFFSVSLNKQPRCQKICLHRFCRNSTLKHGNISSAELNFSHQFSIHRKVLHPTFVNNCENYQYLW